jgi:hypothetical protein
MSYTPDGGAAFPQALDREHEFVGSEGMTLRDYFAATALPKVIEHELGLRAATISPGPFRYEHVAADAYRIADAMLKERNK